MLYKIVCIILFFTYSTPSLFSLAPYLNALESAAAQGDEGEVSTEAVAHEDRKNVVLFEKTGMEVDETNSEGVRRDASPLLPCKSIKEVTQEGILAVAEEHKVDLLVESPATEKSGLQPKRGGASSAEVVAVQKTDNKTAKEPLDDKSNQLKTTEPTPSTPVKEEEVQVGARTPKLPHNALPESIKIYFLCATCIGTPTTRVCCMATDGSGRTKASARVKSE